MVMETDMQHFALIRDGVVADVIALPDDAKIGEAVHPILAADMRPCPPAVEPGWTHDGDAFASPPPPQIDLAALKALLKQEIDTAAEAERLKYITPGAGQAMTYARKVEQAKAAQADADPEPGDYPLLAASIGIDGGDVLAVAATVLSMDAAWEQIGAGIEAARLNGKRAVDLAETAEAARAVEVIWPSP